MSEFLLAVAEGDFLFDFDDLVPKILEEWPSARFFPAQGREADVSNGELRVIQGPKAAACG